MPQQNFSNELLEQVLLQKPHRILCQAHRKHNHRVIPDAWRSVAKIPQQCCCLVLPLDCCNTSSRLMTYEKASSYGSCLVAKPHLYTPLLMVGYTHSFTESISFLRCSG